MERFINPLMCAILLTILAFGSELLAHETPFTEHPALLAVPQGNAKKLDADEIRSLVDSTWYMTHGNWVTYVYPDGKKMKAKNLNSSYTTSGILEIRDDGQFCVKWAAFNYGNMKCRTIWKSGEEYLAVFLGRLNARLKIKRGNTENL